MTAATNPNNAVQGAAYVWYGAFGATEPAQTNAALITDPGAGWTSIGLTQGGVTWEDDDTITDIMADQVTDPIGGRITKRVTTVKFNILEPTLARLALVLNNFGTVSSPASGISVFDPGQPVGGSLPSYGAFLVDGFAPQLSGGGPARRRAIFRKVLNQPKIASLNDPSKQQVYAVSATCYFVSSSISPYVVMDQTA